MSEGPRRNSSRKWLAALPMLALPPDMNTRGSSLGARVGGCRR